MEKCEELLNKLNESAFIDENLKPYPIKRLLSDYIKFNHPIHYIIYDLNWKDPDDLKLWKNVIHNITLIPDNYDKLVKLLECIKNTKYVKKEQCYDI